MALEQLEAFLADQPQESLGPVSIIGPDDFPMLTNSELKVEHEMLSSFFENPPKGIATGKESEVGALERIYGGDNDQRTRFLFAFIERMFAYEQRLNPTATVALKLNSFFVYGVAGSYVAQIIDKGINFEVVSLPALRWLGAHSNFFYFGAIVDSLLAQLATKHSNGNVPIELRSALIDIRSKMFDGSYISYRLSTAAQIDALIGSGLWQEIYPGEFWTDQVIADLLVMPAEQRSSWLAFINHCKTATGAKPSSKWNTATKKHLQQINPTIFTKYVIHWFELVDKGKTTPKISGSSDFIDERQRIHEINGDILRGLAWACVQVATKDICRAITKLAISTYRKVRGLGPRAVKVGNAAVYVLGEIANEEAVGQLAILKVRIKFGTAQKGIEKALAITADRVGIPREELEEMSVPTYGLSEVGRRQDKFGAYTGEILISNSDVVVHWKDDGGKQIKSCPAALKVEFADELKDFKQSLNDIDKMIPAQAARIEQTYLQQKDWAFSIWYERYHEHPLVGAIARRLIWRFDDGKQQASGIFHSSKFVDSQNNCIPWLSDTTRVTLWHPLHESQDTILQWRHWLMENQVQQPFKQAHREIYILTDAEKATNFYSNRFAAHVLKQHQFNALCAARGWKNKLRLMVDDSCPPPHIELPSYQLRAEFWTESLGTEYGIDTNASGSYLYLSTDQVRFYQRTAAPNSAHVSGGTYESSGADLAANHPLPLEQIAPIVFSEILRDVDLFVGVTSIGNDPNWSDGGAQGRYNDYWRGYSFGELGTSAQLRKAVLANIIPKLKISDRCSFSDRFLVVRGDIRTYKIHLGSGNILMEPTDQYLCIVSKQSSMDSSKKVFLPFEGDHMLSIILSKAFLLAEDSKIKDASIVSQIRH